MVGNADVSGSRETGLAKGRGAGSSNLLIVVLVSALWRQFTENVLLICCCGSTGRDVHGVRLAAREAARVQTRIVLGGAHVDMIGGASELESRFWCDLGESLIELVLQSLDGLEIRVSVWQGVNKMRLETDFRVLLSIIRGGKVSGISHLVLKLGNTG